MTLRALVTGSSGFVGRAMVAELVERGYRCTTVDAAKTGEGDLGQWLYAHRQGYPPRRQYDLVVHCAYVIGGRAGIGGNRSALAENLRLDAELFRWVADTEQPHVLYFSSSAAYPVHLQDAHTETLLREDDTDVFGEPDADYGFAKMVGERLAANAWAQGTRVSVVRPFSGYGTTQAPGYPFRDFIDRAKRQEDPFVVWGNAGQRRDWIHVTDVVRAALAVAGQDARWPDWGGPVNLCSGVGTSMFELARQVCGAAGYYPTITTNPEAPMGVMNRVGDPTKMRGYYSNELRPLADGIRDALAGVGS